jgi:hypothetical protein
MGREIFREKMLDEIVESENLEWEPLDGKWDTICREMSIPTHNWEQMVCDLHNVMQINHSGDDMSDFVVERLDKLVVQNDYSLDEICHECGEGIDDIVLEAQGNYHRTCINYRG